MAYEKRDEEDGEQEAHARPQQAQPPPRPPLPFRLAPFPPFDARPHALQSLAQRPHLRPPLLQSRFERADSFRLAPERFAEPQDLGAEGLGEGGGRLREVRVVLADGGVESSEGGR